MSLTYLFRHLLMCSMSLLCWTSHHRQHLQFHWNSSNPIFQSSGFLTVYLGDLIDFLCPYHVNESLNENDEQIEYNTLYLVSENDYHHCQTLNYHPLLRCHRPFGSQPVIYTLSISKYLPYPNLPEFEDGQFYYFVSTSSGSFSQIDQREAGLCETKNMKLILNVEKYYRHFYEEKRHWSRPIVAKRTNLTFIDPNERRLSFSSVSSSAPRRRFDFILLFALYFFPA